MDAHFNEYLAAVVGMQELYGERPDDHPTEFHPTCSGGGVAAAAPVAAEAVPG